MTLIEDIKKLTEQIANGASMGLIDPDDEAVMLAALVSQLDLDGQWSVHIVAPPALSEDDPMIFAHGIDAQRYAEAVGSTWSTVTAIDHDEAERMIAEESDGDLMDRVPEGVAWPIRTDGAEPPEGWSWVEKDDDYDIFDYDDTAAEAMVRAGIATEWGYFDRVTRERLSDDDASDSWRSNRPFGIAINVPEPI